jgi:esterase/lipase superfamily enzyme
VIILIDNSKVEVQNDTSAEIEELIDLVDYYIDNSDDADIKYFHDNVENYDIGKNIMEAMGIFKTLNFIATNPELLAKVKSANRIFKLSGRYRVTDQFDIDKFDNEETQDKYVFKRAQPSWIPTENTGVTTQLQTRLWSFTPTLLDDTAVMYKNIIENMVAMVNMGKYIDNEHSMSKFIPKDKLVELDTVGLQGNIAPNGVQIVD